MGEPSPGASPIDPAVAEQQVRLEIPVVPGVGSGPNELAAFDAALVDAGVADRNLIRLSSVIPPASVITEPDGPVAAPGGWGDRLYVVMAEARTSNLHDRLAAGIGWVQEPVTGRGLFVEHEGHTVEEVETHIRDSLDSLTRSRDVEFGDVHMRLSTTVCEGPAACALVVAVFDAVPWTGAPVGSEG
ncbi:pyruvoyl-dependent arginine decarboxylase [Actinomarinicola tropica]|uniref:Pyruvoyl-dependent arginine decarboxylase AaxB n=1 Tax=Actinomarinicola tropica TaxID=2789776 RepID=A0A5Q2RLB3_9ACTN|nr:pyruvoyl-dependent arginine decarboxylase [Actinomarinicola tropica]QGG96633.1 pyruvoyl-dependent arginine decarboxylase [Actinomarinicola tropica]